MNAQDNGGSAFPSFVNQYDHGYGKERPATIDYGMTMRDYFAAHAGEDDIDAHSQKGYKEEFIIECPNCNRISHRPAMYTREEAKYRYADAMLKARNT